MAKKSKLELVLELTDKLFNNKLSQVQAKLSAATDKMGEKLKNFDVKQIKIFSNFGKTFDPVKINQAFELFDTLGEKLDFTKDINKTKLALQQMGVENVDEVSAKIHNISKVFDDDSMQIAKAANAMTKQIGGSFETNLALLQAGYEKGANLNGDMLDQFKEYGPQMRELGLNASQMLAIMAKAGKDGLFSDKAIDSIKEANLSLKEMGPTQLDALKGIGLSVKDLAGKTSFEAVQLISKAMEGATAQAKQLALTDIFKGAGEDAGMSFILGLGTMELDPNNIESFQAADAELKSWAAKIQSGIANTLGNLPIQDIASFTMTVFGLISILTTLNGVMKFSTIATKSLTAAQWLWNAAMTANPIGIVVVAIIALIGYVALAISKWDDWGAALMLFLGPVGLIISAFKSMYDHWESIKKAFKTDGIIGGLKRIGMVLLDAVLKPLQQMLEAIANVDPTGLAQKGADKLKAFREAHNLTTPGEKEAEVTQSKTPTSPVTPLMTAPVLDGKVTTTGTDKKKEGEDVSKAVGKANQVKKIDIRIDAFNKGGINVAQSAFKGMTKDDLEAWFKEMLARVILNAENA
jgi:hypothetical protein